jgi:polynucleotide 5'-hydroxyl-kinase GRC3/NOL9
MFCGLDTFDDSASNTIFTDLIEQNLILIKLDYSQRNANLREAFSFKGKCTIGLLHGQVQVNGYTIYNAELKNTNSFKWHDLYSAETNSYLSIHNKFEQNLDPSSLNLKQSEENLVQKIRNQLNSYDLNVQKLSEFLHKSEFSFSTSSLIALRPLNSLPCSYISYFDNFKHVYQSNLPLNDSLDSTLGKQFGIYPVQSEFLSSILSESNEERKIANDLLNHNNENEKPPVIMACGGKDVGKSTFLRYLVNSLLNKHKRVAFMDCDPGQCEFTLSGSVSLTMITEPLLGPPHTHLSHTNQSKKCYFLGHLSPNDVPSLYLDLLAKCFYEYESNNLENVPIIVNTMGWNQGLGLCLLKETILLCKPSHLIQINHPIEANKNMPLLNRDWLNLSDGWPPCKRFKSNQNNDYSTNNENINSTSLMSDSDVSSNSLLNSDIDYELIVLKSRAPSKTNQVKCPQKRFSPRDHRNIAIMAYFSRMQDTNSVNFRSVHHLRPYRVSWSKLALHVSHSRVDFNQLFRVFNASLVGLCQIDSNYVNYYFFLLKYSNATKFIRGLIITPYFYVQIGLKMLFSLKKIRRRSDRQDLPGYLPFNYDMRSAAFKCFGFGKF